MLKFSMLLQAIDRVTGPARRIKQSMTGVADAARLMGRDIGAAGREVAAVTRLDRATGGLRRGFAAAGRAARTWAGKAGIGSWGDAAEMAGRGVGSLTRKLGGLAVAGAKWAAAGAGAAGGFALFDLFRTASQFEQFQIMLENMEGSAEKARQSFAWVKQFAQTTPYELADVMEAFVQLKAYGIDPMNGSLRALGDAASGMSKPVMQAVEAMADAITGEFERLKEFGIRAEKQGSRVAFTYRKAGKDIRTEVAATGVEIERTLTGIFADRFGGMMDRQSRTMAGMISNLKDQWSNFLMMVADAGIFDLVKSKIEGLLAKVSQWAKDGTLKRWAETISTKLEEMVKWADEFVTSGKWDSFKSDLATIGSALRIVAGWVLVIARNLDKFRMGFRLALPGGNLVVARELVEGATPRGTAPRAPRPAGKVGTGRMNWGGQQPYGAPRPSPVAGRGAANDLRVGGRAQVDIRVHGPATASLRAIDSQGSAVPLGVSLGRIMEGAA